MSTTATAAGAVGILLAALVFFVVAVGLALLPTIILGAIISAIFGVGFWLAAMYVLGASLALQIVGRGLTAGLRR